jgi:SAM-dependent methyltransferase
MRSFELYGTVAAAFCVCNTINYLLEEEELLKVFRLVNKYLDPGGLFIFDMDTIHAYENVMGDNTIAINREEGSYIWENIFYPEKTMNEVRLTFFIPRQSPDGERVYIKREETHIRRAYSIDAIRRLLEEAGMEWIAAYDELSEEEPDPLSERVYIVAREKYQPDKLYIRPEFSNRKAGGR